MNDMATPLPLPDNQAQPTAEQFVHLRVMEWALVTARHYASQGHSGRLVHDLIDAIHNTPAHLLGEFCANRDLYPVMYRTFDDNYPNLPEGSLHSMSELALAEFQRRSQA